MLSAEARRRRRRPSPYETTHVPNQSSEREKQAAQPASPEQDVTLQRGGTLKHPALEGELAAGGATATQQSLKPGLKERLG